MKKLNFKKSSSELKMQGLQERKECSVQILKTFNPYRFNHELNFLDN